jgi:multidrug efflux pump subunit AcrA (membrane-fusion protein)
MPDSQQIDNGSFGVATRHVSGDQPLDLPSFYDDDTEFNDDDGLAGSETRPWYRQRRWIALIAVVVLVAIVAGIVGVVAASDKKPITYQTTQAATGNLVISVSATGPIQSSTYAVNFSGSGKIIEIDVKVGQQVTAGQVLAKLDPTSLQDAVNQAQASVNSAQTSLNNAYNNQSQVQAQTRASLDVAYNQEQTVITNCKGDQTCINTAQDQYASAQAQANSQNSGAQAQITNAQAQLNTAQTNLTTAQDNLGNATVTAPHAGTIGVINGSVGGNPGASSGSGGSGSSGTFIEILDLTSLQVQANVNETDIGHVAVGQNAAFTVSAYGSQRFRGTVSSVSPLGVTSSNVVTYPVTIDVDSQSLAGSALLPDMTANVSITTAQRAGVLLIPAAAVTYARGQLAAGTITRAEITSALTQGRTLLTTAQSSDPTAAQDQLTLSFVLERAKNSFVIVPVVLGLTDGSSDVVVAGLNDGDSIVVGQTGGSTTTSSSNSGLVPSGGGRFGGGTGGTGRGGTARGG